MSWSMGLARLLLLLGGLSFLWIGWNTSVKIKTNRVIREDYSRIAAMIFRVLMNIIAALFLITLISSF